MAIVMLEHQVVRNGGAKPVDGCRPPADPARRTQLKKPDDKNNGQACADGNSGRNHGRC
jgi:hypothetical protein